MLRRRQIDPRRVVLCCKLEGTWLVDDAIDMEHPDTDVEAYIEGLYSDDSLLVMHEGEVPTYFHIKGLTDKQLKGSSALVSNPALLARWYIQCAVTGFENYEIVKDDGSIYIPPQPKQKPGTAGIYMTPNSWLEKMRFLPDDLAALMSMIDRISRAAVPLPRPSALESGHSTAEKTGTGGQSPPSGENAKIAPPTPASGEAAE